MLSALAKLKITQNDLRHIPLRSVLRLITAGLKPSLDQDFRPLVKILPGLFFVSGVRVDRNAVLLARNRQPVEPGAAQAETGERKVVPPSPEGTGDSSAFAGASSDAALNGKPLGQRRVSMTLDVLAIPYGDVSSEKAG